MIDFFNTRSPSSLLHGLAGTNNAIPADMSGHITNMP